MAKKQSYSPNMGLIAGEAAVAQSEAALGNTVGAFAQGFGSVFGAIQKANQERDARMEAYEASLPGMTNVNLIQDPANKQIITSFLNKQRDEYNRLAQIFDKTKDRGVRDQMEAIKFSLVNLNDQIKVFDQDKMDYRTASDENQLASVITYDRDGFFTNAFTNNAKMQISSNGDLGFNINNNFYNYKDKAGKWDVNANEEETFVLKSFSTAVNSGNKGVKMNPDHVFTNMFAGFKNSTARDMMVLATTDIVGDNRSQTFQEQFASGDPKFKGIYDKIGITAGKDNKYDTEWMFDSKNSGKLKTALAEYFKNVVIDGNTTAYNNFEASKSNDTGSSSRQTIPVGYGVGYITTKSANLLLNDIKNKEEEIISPDGKNYKWNEKKNTYEQLSRNNDGEIIKTPRSNKWILMNSGIWQQGYRVDDYETIELEEGVQKILELGIDKGPTKEQIQSQFPLGRKI